MAFSSSSSRVCELFLIFDFTIQRFGIAVKKLGVGSFALIQYGYYYGRCDCSINSIKSNSKIQRKVVYSA